MKQVFAAAAIAALAACEPAVPDSGAGVGFNDYAQYELERAQREAALTGRPIPRLPSAPAVATAPLNSTAPQNNTAPLSSNAPLNSTVAIPATDLARAGIGQQNQDVGAPLSAITPAAPQAAAQADPTAFANNPGISDEQNFDAVAARETIESDAQRREAQAQNLIVVDPVPLPETRAATGANIVQYALNAPNQRGQEWYSRSILSGDTRFQRNCAGYNNPDEAQRDFLARGGPERDPRGIDPDGDGFACGWDPAPFKLAAGN